MARGDVLHPAATREYDGESPCPRGPAQSPAGWLFHSWMREGRCRREVGAVFCPTAAVIRGRFAAGSGCRQSPAPRSPLRRCFGAHLQSKLAQGATARTYVSSQKEFSLWKNSKSLWLWQDYSRDESKRSPSRQDYRRDEVSQELRVSTSIQTVIISYLPLWLEVRLLLRLIFRFCFVDAKSSVMHFTILKIPFFL